MQQKKRKKKEKKYVLIYNENKLRLAEDIKTFEARKNSKNFNPGIKSGSLLKSKAKSLDEVETTSVLKNIEFDINQTHSSMQKSIFFITVIAAAALLFIAAGVFAFKMQQTKPKKEDLFY